MHSKQFFGEVSKIAQSIDLTVIEALASELVALRERGGRLFLLGVGGSAANCSHAVNDFRKLCGIEAYTPVDNVSELTASTNDEGWDTVFSSWLRTSKAGSDDAILVFSVGGGNAEKNVSASIVAGLKEAKQRGLKVFGVVGNSNSAEQSFTIGALIHRRSHCIVLQKVKEHTRLAAASRWEAGCLRIHGGGP